jgi:diaminopimelate epimerase
MPKFHFYKYQGTGNDFIMIDDRDDRFDITNFKNIEQLCDRRFGIGGDGLILLRKHETTDFEMVYFNSDGKQSSMCGNGGRCIVAFANFLRLITDKKTIFTAIDGIHEAKIEGSDFVHLKMNDVLEVGKDGIDFVMNTGSPHYVREVVSVEGLNVFQEGQKIRYNDIYKEKGINVNFIEKVDSSNFKIRTYERGVEDETYSCGTGVVASSIASSILGDKKNNSFTIQSKGGELKVNFEMENNSFKNIWLSGPAVKVFEGDINI